MYFNQCNETISKVLSETRNLPDEQVQAVLIKAFPFHKSNVVAYREYGKEITRLSGRVMWPTGPKLTKSDKEPISTVKPLNHELYS